jgi:short-subunit dehydrogenase
MIFSFGAGTSVVTGAASGIGAALAVELAARGAPLALVDVDGDGLAVTAERVAAAGGRCDLYMADLGDAAAVERLSDQLAHDHPNLHCLVNNAGVGMIGAIEQVTNDEFEWLFSINFWGAVRLTKALLPALKRQPAARIVNVSSILGIVAAPAQGPYVASKFALRGFSETLAAEMQGTGVRVSTVYPGGVATAIARGSRLAAGVDADAARRDLDRYEKGLVTSAGDAARLIADGAAAGAVRILIGKDAKRADLLQRLMPARYLSVISRRLAGASQS